jgi:hypothetical protein
MTYTYEINSENHTIIVKTLGDLISKDVAAMGLEILSKAKKLNFKVIFDHRMSKNRVSITEAYSWYFNHYDCIDIELRRIPTAYIANDKDWDFYTFFECTCINKGIPIKVFRDENAVSEWLKPNEQIQSLCDINNVLSI